MRSLRLSWFDGSLQPRSADETTPNRLFMGNQPVLDLCWSLPKGCLPQIPLTFCPHTILLQARRQIGY